MTADTVPATAPEPRRLMPVLLTGVFMAALDTAIIAPAIPAMRDAFAIDNREAGLVMTVFILVSLVSTALLANLSDRRGRRPVYLFSVGLFALGSLMIALAPAFWVVLLGRAVQGFGAGGIGPTASAMIGDAFAPEQRGRALGLVGATYGMAFVLGPPVASLLMVLASWQWIFLANLPIAALVIVRGLRALPAPGPAQRPLPLDWWGVGVLFVLLSCLVLGITRRADALSGLHLWPWLLLVATLLSPVLLAIERRAASPMIPLSLFAIAQLRNTYLLTIGAGFGMGSVVFLSSLATLAYGVPARQAGFVLLPLVLASMVGSMGSGRLLNRLGARSIIVCGFAMLGLGYAATAWTGAGLAGFLVATTPVGLGVGIVVGGALRSIAIDEAPLGARTAAQGMVNIATSIGTLSASTAIGALADFNGGGARGFGTAYLVVAALMLVMLGFSFLLRPHAAPVQPA